MQKYVPVMKKLKSSNYIPHMLKVNLSGKDTEIDNLIFPSVEVTGNTTLYWISLLEHQKKWEGICIF